MKYASYASTQPVPLSTATDPKALSAHLGRLAAWLRSWQTSYNLLVSALDAVDAANSQALQVRMPLAAIIVWPASQDPVGWLTCDGSAISRKTYSNLFTRIGTTYGPGDGSTTFNLPAMSPPLGMTYIIKT